MTQQTAIKLFDEKKVRIVWDEEQEKYYFSVVDIVQVLTDSADYQTARKHWKVLKGSLIKEGNETVTNCYQLKLPAADGKQRMTDVADLEQILRIIQSIPSKKAEPVKRWLDEVGTQRIDQMIDPELTFQMAVEDYHRQGYSDRWINERMRSIEMRKELTDEWHRSGIHEPKDFAILTNILTKAWSGMTTREYKSYKGLTKENLRDNMTNLELALNTLAEVTTTELSRQRNPKGMAQTSKTAQEGGIVLVNSFLNHQLDPQLMMHCAEEFARLFKDQGINKIVTIEASGIAPAIMTGYLMDLPVVFIKKKVPKTVDESWKSWVGSFTTSCLSTTSLPKDTPRAVSFTYAGSRVPRSWVWVSGGKRLRRWRPVLARPPYNVSCPRHRQTH